MPALVAAAMAKEVGDDAGEISDGDGEQCCHRL